MKIKKSQIKQSLKNFILSIKRNISSFSRHPSDAEYFDTENNMYLSSICMDMDCSYDVMEYKKVGVFRYEWVRGYRYNLKNLITIRPNPTGLSNKYCFKSSEV